MLKSNTGADKNLMLIRENNMQNWKDEDYSFYDSFFEEDQEPGDSSNDPALDKAVLAFKDEAWRNFQQKLKS